MNPNNLVQDLCLIGLSSIFRFINLAFAKFCREPIVIQLVLEELQLNLFVLGQLCTAAKSLFKKHSVVEIAICVSSAHIPGAVCCRQLGKSFI